VWWERVCKEALFSETAAGAGGDDREASQVWGSSSLQVTGLSLWFGGLLRLRRRFRAFWDKL